MQANEDGDGDKMSRKIDPPLSSVSEHVGNPTTKIWIERNYSGVFSASERLQEQVACIEGTRFSVGQHRVTNVEGMKRDLENLIVRTTTLVPFPVSPIR